MGSSTPDAGCIVLLFPLMRTLEKCGAVSSAFFTFENFNDLLMRRIVGPVIAIVSVLGINFIPLELWLNRDFSAPAALLIYGIENVMAIGISVVAILLFAPSSDNTDKPRTRKETITNFVVPAVFVTFVTGVFVTFFVFGILHTEVSGESVRTAALWILAFLIVEFAGDMIMLFPLTLKKSEDFLNRTLGRVFLLLLCVFLGVFSAAFVDEWFVVPFIALKTLVDLGEQVLVFRDLRTAV
jgi:hypothetical protein